MDRTLHVSIGGNQPKIVRIAPSALIMPSSYTDTFSQEEANLDRTLSELEIEKANREKEFNARLAEIWASSAVIDSKIKAEAQVAVSSLQEIECVYKDKIVLLSSSFTSEIKSIFDKFDEHYIPQERAKVDSIEVNMNVFFEVTVPDAISRQSGQVERDLRRLYDLFEIDKQKSAIKESLLVDNASKHINRTQQRLHDEKALLSATMFVIEDDIARSERSEAMLAGLRHTQAVKSVLQVRSVIAAESETRKSEDVELLDTICETQTFLQKTILEHFGSDSAEADISFPVLERLNSRVARSRRSSLSAD